MARGAQFLTLVTMLRSDLGRSSSVAVGVDDVTRLKHELNKAYETLASKHDWSHLRKTFAKIPLSQGQQYYSFPSDLDFGRIEGAWVWWSDLPQPIERGITPTDYLAFDSTNDQRSDPAQKWDVRWTGSSEQIEIWPIPSTNDQDLQFLGQRKVTRLVNDIDICLLDDWLVVLWAAVNLVKEDDKRSKMGEAQDRLDNVKAESNAEEPDINFATGPEQRDPFKGVVLRVS
jgi:hypothetical protein